MECSRPFERRGEFTRAARCLQRCAAGGHAILDGTFARRASVRQVQDIACGCRLGASQRGAKAIAGKRAARFSLGRRRIASGQESALFQCTGSVIDFDVYLQRQRARCNQRICAFRGGRSGIVGPAGGRKNRRSRGGPKGRQARLEAHAACALLFAGDAVRRFPSASRTALPRLLDTRFRARGRSQMEQWRNHQTYPAVTRRVRLVAGLWKLCPRVARHQNGGHTR